MSIITALRTFIATYNGLATGAALQVDQLGKEPTSYSIDPLPGARVVDTDILGNTTREYPFAFNSMESTAADLERQYNNEFFENFADWLDTQTKAGILPTLASGKTAEKIEALGWGYLFQEGESGTGIYQIQAKLTYKQNAT